MLSMRHVLFLSPCFILAAGLFDVVVQGKQGGVNGGSSWRILNMHEKLLQNGREHWGTKCVIIWVRSQGKQPAGAKGKPQLGEREFKQSICRVDRARRDKWHYGPEKKIEEVQREPGSCRSVSPEEGIRALVAQQRGATC